MKYLSNHASVRSLERGIRYNDIQTILALVKPIHRTGIQFYYCREKDIPYDFRNEENFRKLIGWTVLVSNNAIITAYKNLSKKVLRNIKKKSKIRGRHAA